MTAPERVWVLVSEPGVAYRLTDWGGQALPPVGYGGVQYVRADLYEKLNEHLGDTLRAQAHAAQRELELSRRVRELESKPIDLRGLGISQCREDEE